MLKKHSILLFISAALLLMFLATCVYPGGSQADEHAIGYDYKNNYICNLFGDKAVNGMDNPSRIWATCGMLFFCAGVGMFFYRFSKKIPLAKPSKIIRITGVSAMCFSALIASPLHDLMVTISGTLALISIFYITVYVFKSKLTTYKILSILTLLVFYTCNIMYYFSFKLEYLPIMQKVSLSCMLVWVLGLEYTASSEDFEHLKQMNS